MEDVPTSIISELVDLKQSRLELFNSKCVKTKAFLVRTVDEKLRALLHCTQLLGVLSRDYASVCPIL
jgi:hypothetical protein